MNKLDTIYFEAVMTASEEGSVSAESLKTLADNARKFVIIDEVAEAVRFYERILSLWRTLKENRNAVIPSESRRAFGSALNEYAQLLTKLDRTERLQLVQEETAALAAASGCD